MTYLLDVNALVALGTIGHEFHERVAHWIHDGAAKTSFRLATCSITELGFIRVLAQVPHYNVTVSQARTLLARLKRSNQPGFSFFSDDHDASRLPQWVRLARQTTDGHLAELARARGALFATLDRGIPDAFVIPTVRNA